MNHGVMEMVLGFVAGCVIASGVWALLWALMRNERRASKQRGAAMQAIAEECAEIDKGISSLAMKTLIPEALQSMAAPRLETIVKTLTINMRFFDAYYVKYIESLITLYRQTLSPLPKSPAAVESKTAETPPAAGEEIAAPQADIDAAPAFGAVPVNFDQTWQYDFSKEKPSAAATDVEVMERPPIEETPPEPTFEATIEKEEKGPAVEVLTPKETTAPPEIEPAAAEAEKADVEQPVTTEIGPAAVVPETKVLEKPKGKKPLDVEREIVFELDRGRKAKEKAPSKAMAAEKEEKPLRAPDDTASVEILLKPQTAAENEEPAIIAEQKVPPEEFISGEDLVNKIDTFFGIKD
jgi:hypothetical protein